MEEEKKQLRSDRSFESVGSKEDDEPHYNYESDGEPPTDQVGYFLQIVKKRLVTKRIITPGQNLGKPGRPYIVKVSLKGYFASKTEISGTKEE